MLIAVKENSHLQKIIEKITSGEVEEKSLMFGLRYGAQRVTLEDIVNVRNISRP